ncbi:S-adenosyl-L-methionine-dependent methyltransferase [Podospora fimiseda]|uniref:Protein-lysine N-methyltransferase EFM4 n=1 Tax=Podospora fimiseda TaxID=252190 RepID=A0AAN7BWE2_9PEZI|nr:S-adenosyl-L-methionine-dependent methyltransferase [Podospora fimiseda]
MAAEKPTHLEPSKLGTREYWESLYTTEITNHASNPQDEGTIWFDDSDAQSKIFEYLTEDLCLPTETTSILDLGSGNGSLLFLLRSGGFTGPLLGVDYSSRSIELSQQIALTRQAEADENQDEDDKVDYLTNLEFKEWDALNGDISQVSRPNGGYDLILDKGTFDAVSLSDELDAKGRRINEGYGERVLQLLKMGGYFLVTSCNWTEIELQKWFEGAEGVKGNRLKMVGRIEYPSFSFGGVKGQTISTLCFEKVVAV